MQDASRQPASTSRLRATGLLFVEAALIGAAVNLASTVGFYLPGADPFGGRAPWGELAAEWPGGLRRGAMVGVVFAVPLALMLGLNPKAAAWRWTPAVTAVIAFGVSVSLTAFAISGMLLPFERVLQESWLPLWVGVVAFLLVLLRSASAARRFRRVHTGAGQPDRERDF